VDNGHQTPILSNRRDLPVGQVAYRMFERWRQENFFKDLREEYALDALADYSVVPDEAALGLQSGGAATRHPAL